MSDLQTIMKAAREGSERYLSGLDPLFEMRIGVCKTYTHLLRGDFRECHSHEKLMDLAIEKGRVIFSGRGASGKTTVLHRLVLAASERGCCPVFIDLSQWDQAASEAWHDVSASPMDALDYLLRRFGDSPVDLTALDALEPSMPKIVILDGLNETPGSTAETVLSAADNIAALLINVSIIVSDRLVRRSLQSEDRWVYAMPLPINAETIARFVDKGSLTHRAAELLESPFFLDRAIQGDLQSSPLETIRALMEKHASLDSGGITKASEAAFRAYDLARSRSFDVGRFEEAAGSPVTRALTSSGILLELEDGRLAFKHHWIHDYLSSLFVATNSQLWAFDVRHATLDSLTFKANSFDAIAFVLQLLSTEDCEVFLRAVYDWNPYAAGYALAEADAVGQTKVPQELRIVILAMLAERRFDRHFQSAQKAADALDLFREGDALSFRETDSLDSLFKLVRNYDFTAPELKEWQFLYTLPTGELLQPRLLELLSDEDSILGWTVANVIKRLSVSTEQLREIIELSTHETSVVRWRSVHVMGALTDEQAVGALFERLRCDDNDYVRYGSVRSLIELASRDSSFTKRIVDELVTVTHLISASPIVLDELCRAVFITPAHAPSNWVTNVSPIFNSLLDAADDMLEVEHWSGLNSRLRIHHKSTTVAPA